MPSHCRRLGASWSQNTERSATTTGCVFTSTTEAATLVRPTDVFQLQKWSASMPPAPAAIAVSREVRTRH